MPAGLVVLVLTGPVLARFPRSELYWGAHSLEQMWQCIYRTSFAPNEHWVPPMLAGFLHAVQPQLVEAVFCLPTVYLALLFLNPKLRGSQAWSRLRIAGSVTTVLGLTLSHWLQFRFLQIPLPLDRTSLFIIPLVVLIVGAVLSVTPATSFERAVRGLGILVAASFIGSLRDSYFQEWKGYGADVRAAFPAIVDLSRRAAVREITADWKYAPSLNFYRILYAANGLDQFRNFEKIPPGQFIYVLPSAEYKELIRTEGLQVVYRGAISDLVIAIKSGPVPRNEVP